MNQPLSSLEEGAAPGPDTHSVRASADFAAAPGLDLDDLMARLREEVQARKRQAAREAATSAPGTSTPPASTAGFQPRRVRAEDLVELPEAAFVMTAYRLLLGREAEREEADRQIDRLLLGRVERTEMLAELMATEEARATGVTLEGLTQARRRERLMSSGVARLFLSAANVFRTVYLLPKRIRQFVKRVETLEQRATGEASRVETRIETLEQEVVSLQQEVLSLRAAVHSDVAKVEAKLAPRAPSASPRRRSDAR